MDKKDFFYRKEKTLLTISEMIDILMVLKLGTSLHKKAIVNHRLGENIHNI